MKTERAWSGGPLRRVGTGNGSPSRYVCEDCQDTNSGVYFVPQTQRWLCGGCKSQEWRRGSGNGIETPFCEGSTSP